MLFDLPPVALAAELLDHAASAGASDLHAEPTASGLRLRMRLDGRLVVLGTLPLHRQAPFVARLKVLAELDLGEKRRPQDGRFSHTVVATGRVLDVRVSTLPTAHGEKVVLRLLDPERLPLDLEALGMSAEDAQRFVAAVERPHGLVLVTGPTGSGKTTTLYAALQRLNVPERHLLTIEDPVEYRLEGLTQASVRADLDFTFAAALRAFLRQDPDVIMVGEIRDRETAEIAVRAALTGHLVLSTLHTNDAPSTVSRLFDVGAEPFLVASCLRLVVAQRLVRRVCPSCAEPTALLPDVAERLGPRAPGRYAKGRGCAACHGTGYRGRVPLFELMPVTEPLAALIGQRSSTEALREAALGEGLRTLRQSGLDRIAHGETTPEEVLRETA